MEERFNKWETAGKMIAENNFIVLLPSFKLERSLTFVLTCDSFGLQWLREKFLHLAETEGADSFVIGDGVEISSDNICKLLVTKVPDAPKAEIAKIRRPELIWGVSQEGAIDAIGKLHTLITTNIPGHQYLEAQRGPVRVMVITKDEYRVDKLRAMRDKSLQA